MEDEADIVAGAREVFGDRLHGVFLFGSRMRGDATEHSDLDVGVWIDAPLRRQSSWVPWFDRFSAHEPICDPTFFTTSSLDRPTGWLLEAVHGGTRVLYDPSGELRHRLDGLAIDLRTGRHRRREFMGLPYYEADRS
jgi:Nucleotidyltransferase domain